MFEKKYINEFINKIEEKHNDKFYNIFLKMVTDFYGSGASEYEIYFNYMLTFHGDKIQIRELKWKNCSEILFNDYNDYDYVACHYYMRKSTNK